jgi:hypothetical protein
MKKIILIFLVLTFSVTLVFGSDKQRCTDISELAEIVMKKRQANVPIRTIMEVNQNKVDPRHQDMVEQMILDAYEWPLMNLDKNKQTYIIKFGNKWYLKCIKNQI